MRGDSYQISLIALGVMATALFGVFFYREVFPEYKIYQNAYVELEQFRSTYTGEPPPAFKYGIKQIVLESPTKGPAEIDRCTSCHVALQFQHFSPTQIVKDVNGNIILDENGVPKKEANPNYVWSKLEQKIADLTNAETNVNLTPREVQERLAEAEKLKELAVAHVWEKEYSMAKVLQMHPLMGRETRPFEFHSIDSYGCTSCHGGNGRGLAAEKAHGPVYDGQYEIEDVGPVPKFTESDRDNDPEFARVFNHKPGHELLFQTTPILVGALMEAKCMQCHQSSKELIQSSSDKAKGTIQKLENKAKLIQESYSKDLDALSSLVKLRLDVSNNGVLSTVQALKQRSEDYQLLMTQRDHALKQSILLEAMVGGADGLRPENAQPARDVALEKINTMLSVQLGSLSLANALNQAVDKEGVDVVQIVREFIEENRKNPEAQGDIFVKANAVDVAFKTINEVNELQGSLSDAIQDPNQISKVKNDVDLLTNHYAEGQRLFISQACYPCHRIAGFSRGGVGMDLTQEGKSYPWFIKESIVWPQADLKTSTMPNFHLDHKEIENLMTFLLAQKGQNKAVSESAYKASIAEWEAGKKQPWEKPVSPAEMHDLDYSMTVFATEGCAACHRLKGYTSNVGFTVEKSGADFATLYKEKEWFRRTIPESISGSDLVRILEKNQAEIDAHISSNVRENSLLEQIDATYRGNTESFYSNFAYTSRAKNNVYKDAELAAWKERVHRVLMMYVQEYGLGRIVGPKPNWSGVYRSDEWLMEHFRKPSSTVVRSIMPAFPFDETKFQALTYMLNVLGSRNRDANHQLWDFRGFNPEVAYDMYCSQCHGNQRVGNGEVSEWIYPVPKNLRNADFMQNLTRQRAKESILHGVKGGPMPPWGEAPDKATTKGIPVLRDSEVDQLVDWLYSGLPGETQYKTDKSNPKWQYEPQNVLEELKKEGSELKKKTNKPLELSFLPTGEGYFAALEPQASSEVTEVFDIIQSPAGSPDPLYYYINKKYYTPENLEAGKAYFELNCAVCHGREGDGTGIRAGVMQDAKPRMLTNLNWIDTRDDLRLLRSIKYGVQGTSMQPWGDQTSSLQRMQLVMFIRSLSQEQELRDKLYKALYQSFDEARITVDNARIEAFPGMVELNNSLKGIKQEQQSAAAKVKQGEASSEEAAQLYKQQLDVMSQIKSEEKKDAQFNELKTLINAEKAIFEEIGLALIANDKNLFPELIKMIKLHGHSFSLNGSKLELNSGDLNEEGKFKEQISNMLSKRSEKIEAQINIVQGKIPSPERAKQLKELNVEKNTIKTLNFKILAGFEESKRLQQQQKELITKIYGTK